MLLTCVENDLQLLTNVEKTNELSFDKTRYFRQTHV